MKKTQVPESAGTQSATVCRFPLQRVMERRQAAAYLGIPARRMRYLVALGYGPASIKGSACQFRKDDLDQYSAVLFARAGLGPVALAHYRKSREQADRGLDPFLDMASRDELNQALARYASRAVIGVGLVIIVLSHTPLSRILFHVLR